MSLKGYERVKVLGKGSFGEAVLLRGRDDGRHVVVKRVNLGQLSTKEKDEAQNEVRILRRLDHPNIVKYVESFSDRATLCILMEYVDGGDLGQRIKGRQGRLIPEDQILHIFVQLCLAVKYLHDKHILHRDLKTQNIFLSSHKHHPVVKLGDFGISTALQSTVALAKTMCGTPYYFSPELCQNKPYNNKSDVWSLGCILYELCTLKHAFDGSSMQSLMKRIVRGQYKPVPPELSESVRMLVDATLEKDVARRPSVNRILSLKWMQERVRAFVDTPMPRSREASPSAHGGQSSSQVGNGVKGAARPLPGKKPTQPGGGKAGGGGKDKDAADNMHEQFNKLLGGKGARERDRRQREKQRSNSEPGSDRKAPSPSKQPYANAGGGGGAGGGVGAYFDNKKGGGEEDVDPRPRPASGGGDSRLEALRRQAAKHKADVEKKLDAVKQRDRDRLEKEALEAARKAREAEEKERALAAREAQQRKISDAQQLARKRSEQYLQERKQQEAEIARLKEEAEERRERLKRLQRANAPRPGPSPSANDGYNRQGRDPEYREYLKQREEGFKLDLVPGQQQQQQQGGGAMPYANLGGIGGGFGVQGAAIGGGSGGQGHAIDRHVSDLRRQMNDANGGGGGGGGGNASKFAVLNRLPRSPGRDTGNLQPPPYPDPGGYANPDNRPLPRPGGPPPVESGPHGNRIDLDNFLEGFDDPSRTRRAGPPARPPTQSPPDGGGAVPGEESAAMMLWNQRRAAIEAKRAAQPAPVANTARGVAEAQYQHQHATPSHAPPAGQGAGGAEDEEALARRLWEERRVAYEQRLNGPVGDGGGRMDEDLMQGLLDGGGGGYPDAPIMVDPYQEAREYEAVQSRLRRDVLDQVLTAQDDDDDFFEEAPASAQVALTPNVSAQQQQAQVQAPQPGGGEPNEWAEGVIKTHLIATLGHDRFQTAFAALQAGDDRTAHAALQGHEAMFPLFSQLLYYGSQ